MFTKHLYKLDTNDEIKRYTNKFINISGCWVIHHQLYHMFYQINRSTNDRDHNNS